MLTFSALNFSYLKFWRTVRCVRSNIHICCLSQSKSTWIDVAHHKINFVHKLSCTLWDCRRFPRLEPVSELKYYLIAKRNPPENERNFFCLKNADFCSNAHAVHNLENDNDYYCTLHMPAAATARRVYTRSHCFSLSIFSYSGAATLPLSLSPVLNLSLLCSAPFSLSSLFPKHSFSSESICDISCSVFC